MPHGRVLCPQANTAASSAPLHLVLLLQPDKRVLFLPHNAHAGRAQHMGKLWKHCGGAQGTSSQGCRRRPGAGSACPGAAAGGRGAYQATATATTAAAAAEGDHACGSPCAQDHGQWGLGTSLGSPGCRRRMLPTEQLLRPTRGIPVLSCLFNKHRSSMFNALPQLVHGIVIGRKCLLVSGLLNHITNAGARESGRCCRGATASCWWRFMQPRTSSGLECWCA